MAQNTNYIDRMAKSLYTDMKGERLDKGLEEKRPSDRIGVFQELLIDAIRDSTLCCFNGMPYYYNSRIYVPFGKGTWDAFNSLVLRVADKCGLPPGDKTKLEGVKKVCRGEVVLNPLEVDSSIIVLKNGVLDLNDDMPQLRKFNKKYKQTTQLDFDYNPDEQPYLWTDVFLDAVLDEQSQRVLQEFMGAIFIDRRKVKLEKMLILYGAGSNGKSVIQQTLIGLLGEDNVKTLAISDLISGAERKQNIASINGKRLNYCSEMQTREFGANADALKALISGEPFEVRLVYINNFTARNIPLLMANANRIPYMKDTSHGLSRRLIILPFERVIEEEKQDRQLAKKLKAEYPAILNWMLQGRRRLIANHYQFSETRRLKEIVADAQAEGSSVLQFMKAKDYSRGIIDVEYDIRWLKAEQLYFAYGKWCVENEIVAESQKKFSQTLKEYGYNYRRASAGSLFGVYQLNPRPIKEEYKRKNENDEIEGMDNLAHWCGVSRQTIEKALRQGYFKIGEHYRKEGNRYWFFLAQCRVAIRRFLRAMSKSKQPSDRVSMEVKAERRKFNKYMHDNGLPFRKYEEPTAGNTVIYVTDEFNYQLDKNDHKRFVKFPTDVEFDPSTAPDIPDEDYAEEKTEQTTD